MKRRTLLAVMLAAPAVAHADERAAAQALGLVDDYYPKTNVLRPPRYWRERIPADALVTVRFVTDTAAACREILPSMGRDRIYGGCYAPDTDQIIMPHPRLLAGRGDMMADILEHELAHKYGWRHVR